MNKQSILVFIISLCLISCEYEEPSNYHTELFPIKEFESFWIENEFFTINMPITIRLESRLVHNYPETGWPGVGRFEPINFEDTKVLIGSDIYIGNDTIKKLTNLLENGLAEIETCKIEVSGDTVPKNYIIWINKNLEIDYTKNKGYLTIYFKTTTLHNYLINDSTLVYIE